MVQSARAFRSAALLLVVPVLTASQPAGHSGTHSAVQPAPQPAVHAAPQASDTLPSPERSPRWAFVDVVVVPMGSERTLPRHTVVVEDDRIVAMGPDGEVDIPADARRIEGNGRHLLPGLAEMHAHVPPGQDPPREYVEEVLFLYLANGITTIRGMLGAPYQLDLRDEIRRGEVAGPQFYVGAPSINGNTAPTPADAEARVREHAEAGYDFLKIHPGVPRDSWDRMVEVAGEVGITYGGHVPQDVGLRHAMETGIATVDHLDGYVELTRQDGVSGDTHGPAEVYAATDDARLEALVADLADAGVWLVPTQYLWNHLNGVSNADSLLALPEFRYIPANQRESYRGASQSRADSPSITEESTRAHERMRHEFLSATHEGGARILMGTDSPQLFNVPGFALHREIPLMEAAGMSPYEVLLTGTRNVGEFVETSLGQDGSFGTVGVGQRADLILVEGNPLESLDVLRSPAGVMFGGQWLPGSSIRAGLGVIESRYADGS